MSIPERVKATAIFASRRKFSAAEMTVVLGGTKNQVAGALYAMVERGELQKVGHEFKPIDRHPGHAIFDRQARRRRVIPRLYGGVRMLDGVRV